MNIFCQVAVIAALAFCAAGLTWGIKGPPSRTERCDAASLKSGEICLESIPEDGVVLWVDARSRKEWLMNGVKDSVLWNLDPAEDMLAFEASVAPKVVDASRVVVYCGDENCGISRQVADRIRALGLGTEVFVLHGGWKTLHSAGKIQIDEDPLKRRF